MTSTDPFAPLVARYRQRLPRRLAEIEQLLRGVEGGDSAALEQLRVVAHRLAGSGGTYGFPAISTAGHALEESLSADVPARARDLLDALEAAAWPAAGCQAAVAPGPSPLRSSSRGRILLAEDDPDTVGAIRHRLEAAGFEVVHCADGAAAVRAFEQGGVSLCVLDIRLVGALDGLEVLARIRAHSATTPVVMVTAREREADVLRAFSLGADDYVTKPFRPRELEARLERQLAAARERARRAADSPGVIQGAFSGAGLLELAQMLAGSGRSGRLWIRAEAVTGSLLLAEGRLSGARGPGATTTATALKLLAVPEGEFEFVPGPPDSARGVLLDSLLLEAARRRDEDALTAA